MGEGTWILLTVPNRTLPVPSSSSLSDDTRSRILVVATAAFAERGIEGVTLRELTGLAGANVAAINYHFGSKEGLTEAIFDELAPRLNTLRGQELAQILDAAAQRGERPAVADIVASFARPYFAPEHAQDGGLLAQLVLKHRLAPSQMTQRVISRHFDPMAHQYIHAFTVACPDIEPTEFAWRYM
ncbi:MAG: TetR/AcrR family transcriptional regulator, partial [Comamonadaceae bacterium]